MAKVNRVEISAGEAPLPQWSKSLKLFALKVLARLGRNQWDLSVLLCSDETISDLNFRYRGKAEATDILSFNMGKGGGRGDPLSRFTYGGVVISLDTLKENARRFNVSEDEELRRLLIHGILHLDGMDHKTHKKDEPMLILQEQILEELAEVSIMGRNV
jgi:probable rRNA maturation factor